MHALDLFVLGGYLALVAAVGLRAGRQTTTATDYALAGRSLPAWAVGLSIVATETSALTFIGAPIQSLRGDWTYAQLALGSALGRLLVGSLLIGAYYRAGVVTVYDFLGQRFGVLSQTVATVLFTVGRLLGSGVRLYGGAIALVVVARIPFPMAIALIAGVAVAYTMLGGLRSVVWTDVIQGLLLGGGALLALYTLFQGLDQPVAELVAQLRADDSHSKLRFFDFTPSLQIAYTFWAGLIGSTVLTMSTHGTDQDMIQRALACEDASAARRSLALSALISVPITLLFLGVGSLLWLTFAGDTGAAAKAAEIAQQQGFASDARGFDFLFPVYILESLPVGLRGLILAALFATAMSSLDSAVSALASTTTHSLVRPWLQHAGRPLTDEGFVRWARGLAPAFGLLLVLVALVVWLREGAGDAQSGFGVLALGLKVLTWIFPPLLGIFLVGTLSQRGSDRGNLIALATGIGSLLLIEAWPVLFGVPSPWAWTWNPVVGCALSGLVALAFAPRKTEAA